MERTKRDLDATAELYCSILFIDKREFFARVKDACDRKRIWYPHLKAQRDKWARIVDIEVAKELI